jgi:hypothetical protein
LQWIDLNNSEMQLIDLQSSSIWRQKFIDLRAELETIEKDQFVGSTMKIAENEVLKVWNYIPETFDCLKNVAMASVFSSTYSCESLISVMNFVKSNYRNNVDEEASTACIALKTTQHKPDIKYLSSLEQQQKSH